MPVAIEVSHASYRPSRRGTWCERSAADGGPIHKEYPAARGSVLPQDISPAVTVEISNARRDIVRSHQESAASRDAGTIHQEDPILRRISSVVPEKICL